MSNESDIKNYKKLFDICLAHSSSLFILLNRDLSIQTISPMVEKILYWDKDLVCNKSIIDVFNQNLTDPFLDVNNPTVKCEKITYVFFDECHFKIIWSIIPIFDYNQECELIFIVGNGSKEFKPSEDIDSNSLDTDDKLFDLSKYHILDIERVRKSINYDDNLLKDILMSMVYDEIPRDLEILKELKLQSAWDEIEKIAHKMKGGAMYCGTSKMQYACLFFELYKKSNKKDLLDKLYNQLVAVSLETADVLKKWILEN